MKTAFTLFISCILFSCLSFRHSPNATRQQSLSNPRDTFLLDTLVIDGTKDKFITNSFSIEKHTDEIIFKQIIANQTNDTLEIMARASAGWVIPVFERVVNPNSYSKISYQFLTKNHKGIVNTEIDISYKKSNATNKIARHLTVILSGRIE